MRTRIAWTMAAALVCGLSGAAAAQDGLRSASLRESGVDLFRVDPDFYQRLPDPRANRLFVPVPYAVPAPYWYVPPVEGYRPRAGHRATPRSETGRRDLPYAERILPPATASLPPLAPGTPKTFYVIPGCYAGDRPPEPESLRPGCRRAKVTIIPPG
ncbi:MAG: hypothetical protein HY824_14560 [Acidobacteria bacterium]|nr:hypothetical protein [Acidobacteriota bacterium]